MSHEGEEDLLEYSDNEQEIQVDNKETAVEGTTENEATQENGEASTRSP